MPKCVMQALRELGRHRGAPVCEWPLEERAYHWWGAGLVCAAYLAAAGLKVTVLERELPDFSCLRGRDPAEHHTAGIIIGPSLDYMDRAYLDAKLNGWSRKPVVETVIPSTLDDSLAPPACGELVLSAYAPELPGGESWDKHRDAVADHIIETVSAHAPNFRASLLGRQSMSPLDLGGVTKRRGPAEHSAGPQSPGSP